MMQRERQWLGEACRYKKVLLTPAGTPVLLSPGAVHRERSRGWGKHRGRRAPLPLPSAPDLPLVSHSERKEVNRDNR